MRKILLGTLALVAGCTAVPGTPVPAPQPTPPAPPAACLLDPAVLERGTGVAWAPDAVTASDTRCVYDPAGGDGSAFVVVDRADGTDVETPAALCEDGTRADRPAGGWVCRFGEGVLGAGRTGGAVVTVAAAELPTGVDGARLAEALGAELDRLATG